MVFGKGDRGYRRRVKVWIVRRLGRVMAAGFDKRMGDLKWADAYIAQEVCKVRS
jgi:hypothetical protein